MHKNREKPPGRPGIDSLYSRLGEYSGEYSDTYLHPIAVRGKAFVRDSRDIISLLQEQEVVDSTLLITIDVESLYTNIKQTDAINAAEWAFHKYMDIKQE